VKKDVTKQFLEQVETLEKQLKKNEEFTAAQKT
jgi:exodeoxyribonuclease VII large subunit